MQWVKLKLSYTLAALSLGPLLLNLFITSPSFAVTGQWVDASTIKVGDQIFTDSNLDGNYTFKYHHENCDDTITLTKNGDGRPNVAQGTLTRYSYNPVNKGCTKGTPEHIDFDPATLANSDIQYYWVNPQVISTSDHDSFKRFDGQGQFNGLYFKEGDDCPDAIRANDDHKTGTFTEYHSPSGNIGPIPIPFAETNGCNQGSSKNITIYKLENAPNGDPAHDSTVTGGSSNNTCNVPYISWIICPLIEVGYKVIQFLEGLISGLLVTPDLSPIEPIWGSFRNLANVLFVLLFLIVIFSNMFSIHLDAYTVKKLLPKLVAAAILVQFSFIFSKIAIDLSNVTGAAISSGANGLIPAVGSNQNNVPAISSGIAILGGGTAGLALGAVAAPEIWVGIIITILLLIFSGLISLLVVFFTLTLRIVFIEMFVILSPIAFALWVLPNTDKYFRDWLKNFTKLLLMYPLVRLLFAVGNLINQSVNNSANRIDYSRPENIAIHIAGTLAPIAVFAAVPGTIAITGAFINKVTGGSVGKAGSFGKNLNAGLGKNVRAGVKEGAAVKYLGSDSRAKRAMGRILTGNAMSFGTAGRRKVASTVDAAKAAQSSDANKQLVEAGIGGNNRLLEDLFKTHEMKDDSGIAITDGSGNTIQETAEEYAKRKGIKITEAVKTAALQRMNNQGGTKELLRIHEDLGLNDPSSPDYAKNKVLWDRALEGKTGELAKKAPHTVRADRYGAYKTLNGAAVANLDGDVADTYVRNALYETDSTGSQIALDATGNRVVNNKGASNFVQAAAQVSQSSTLRSTVNSNLKSAYLEARNRSADLAGTSVTIQGVTMTGQDFAEAFINAADGTIRETESLNDVDIKTMVNQVRASAGRPALP